MKLVANHNHLQYQSGYRYNSLWHSLSCNWIWAIALFLCYMILSINAASSATIKHDCPVIQTLPRANPQHLMKPQTERILPPWQQQIKPEPEPPHAPKKSDLNGVT